jgi:spermidine synthase
MEMNEKERSMVAMDQTKATGTQKLDLWYRDSPDLGRGCALSIRIKDVLCHYHSRFQEIAVFETDQMGRMLVLDGVTMLTEFDEFAYHEMIAHVPMITHPNPSRVLVIGGGDGGTIREVLKHPEVSEVHLCEIDEEVVAACRKFLPALASGFDDPRVRCFYEDGAAFVKEHPESYDVIIVDSTDPLGPGQVLFQPPFYRDMKQALTKEGIAVTQCESIYFHPAIIGTVAAFARAIFPHVGYYQTLVPTYPSGIIGFMSCSLRYDPTRARGLRERASKLRHLKYYTPALHRASFILPRFGENILGGK